jgi:FkbM family methyltransferase
VSDSILSKEFPIGTLSFINEYETRVLIYEIFYQNSYLINDLNLNPGSVIIDVGANIGLFSLFALKHCKYDAVIYSFEPIPDSFECLKRNLAPFSNKVQLYNMGIGDVVEECSVEFTLFGDDFSTATYKPMDKMISNYNPLQDYNTLLKISRFRNRFLYKLLRFLPFMRNYLIKKNFKKQTQEKKVICTLTSLGQFIEKNKIEHVDFIKIDVEGAEFDVVKSIKPEQFSMIKQLCIEVHDINNRVEQLDAYLQEHGYITQIHRNSIYEDLGFNQHMIYAKRPD